MPLVQLHTSTEVPLARQTEIMSSLSKLVADITGKPEAVVMVTLVHGPIMMAKQPDNAAFVDVRGIGGLTRAVNTDITAAVCALLQSTLGISPDRVYVTFMDVQGTMWGCDSKTFR